MDIERKDFIYNKMCSVNMDISSVGYAKLDDNWHLENPIKFNYSRFYFILDGQGEITVNGIKTILKKVVSEDTVSKRTYLTLSGTGH